jgi:spermidine synthase
VKAQAHLPADRALGPVLGLFLLSGFAGLLYEIVWMKLLTLVIGNTMYSVTAVLTAFMGGLALGSAVAGRFGDRPGSPLRLYGQLEIVIGLTGIAVLLLLSLVEPAVRGIDRLLHPGPTGMALVRFGVCVGVLLLPATLMGATLPILSRYVVSDSSRTAGTVGRLYGLNSLGAALGALAAAFVLIPTIGLSRTTWFAAAINLLVGYCATALARREATLRKPKSPAKPPEPESDQPGARVAAAILGAIGLSGLAGMVYQLSWTRVLTLFFGSSVYVFGLIVSAFITGLALGSIAAGPLTRRRPSLLVLAGVQLGIGLAGFALMPLLGHMAPLVAAKFTTPERSFAGLQALEFAVVFGLVLVPTALMGAAFPLAASIYAQGIARIGRQIGMLYAANTLGAITGVLTAGLLLIPHLGAERTLLLAVAVNVAAAVLILALTPSLRPVPKAALVGASVAFAASTWLLPPWNKLLLTTGPYLYADRYAEIAARKGIPLTQAMSEGRKLVFFREGLHAAVSVTRNQEGDLSLGINGKTDATARADAPTQLLVGHLPLLLKPDAREVLLIGMGSGMTLAAIERHPVKAIDVVELEPAVVEASRQFDPFTGAPLDDHRVKLNLADGRQYLSLAQRPYDVVISEPSNPWVSGMANLFTREFFESARQHLRPGGIMGQWVHAYSMAPEDFKTVVRTFAEVFPHTTLWEADLGNDYLLIGSTDQLRLDLDSLQATLSSRRLAADLAITNTADVPSLLAKLVLTPEGVRTLAGEAPVHTDDNARLEYSAPRGLLRGRSSELLRQLYAVRAQPPAQLAVLGWTSPPQDIAHSLATAFAAKQEVVAGYIAYGESADDQAAVHLERARSIMPTSLEATYLLARLYQDAGHRALAAQDAAQGQRAYQASVSVVDGFLGEKAARLRNHFLLGAGYAGANIELGNLLLAANQGDAAAAAFRRSLSSGIEYAEAHNNLGAIEEKLGRPDSAEAEYQRALELHPDYLSARMNLGSLWLRKGRSREAIEQYRQALRHEPENAIAHFNLGAAYFQQRAWKEADQEWRRALALQPEFEQARQGLTIVADSLRSP